MQLLQNILLVGSVMVLGFMLFYAVPRLKIPGALQLFLMILSVLVWTLFSFLEVQARTLGVKLLWRNFQQIGAFMAPLTALAFSAAYTTNTPAKRFTYVATVIEILALLLIFTDPLHHWMRTGVELLPSAVYGETLVVHSTALGSLLVAFNFSLAPISLLLLIIYARRLSPPLRRPVQLIVWGIGLTFVTTLLKASVLESAGVYIQMPVLYTPGVALLCYAVFRSEFLGLSPIARDKVFNIIEQGILVVDEAGKVVDHNSRAAELLGALMPVPRLRMGANIQELLKPLGNDCPFHVDSPDVCVAEFPLSGGGGILLKRYKLGGVKGVPIGYVLTLTDITAQKNYEQQLRERAETDPLTGALNREGLRTAYERQRESFRGERPATVFMIDVDHFKSINDQYGHMTGDEVLADFSRTLRSTLHREDIVGRLGGDEFAVILPGIARADAYHIAEKFRRRVAERLPHENVVPYTVSIGVTDNMGGTINLEALLREADTALYRAKAAGRNRTALCGADVNCAEPPDEGL